MEVLFFERQRFKQLWLWFILLGINVLFLFGFVQQVFMGVPFGNKPVSDMGLGVICMIMPGVTFFFWNMRMETKITSEGIFVRFFPFQLSPERIYWEYVSECYVRTYKPLQEYGGWGRRGFRHDRVLNVGGNEGIQIVFSNGSRLLIGTQKAMEARLVLVQLGKNIQAKEGE